MDAKAEETVQTTSINKISSIQIEPGNQARVTSDYSWIHGYIGHTDTECNHPAYGHIPHATLTKHMGESNNHIPPVSDCLCGIEE